MMFISFKMDLTKNEGSYKIETRNYFFPSFSLQIVVLRRKNDALHYNKKKTKKQKLV